METKTPGNRLKAIIKEKGYTQEQFATAIGIGLTQLKECLTGKKDFYSLPYEILLKMSKVLTVDLGYLIGVSVFPYEKKKIIIDLSENETNILKKSIDEYQTILKERINELENLRIKLDTMLNLINEECSE